VAGVDEAVAVIDEIVARRAADRVAREVGAAGEGLGRGDRR